MFWQNLLVLVVSVLVPIVPAYLLYKLLPSTGTVAGPFQGLQIKLTGAFAGYFLVLLAVMAFWKTQSNYEVWKVTGWTNLSDDADQDKRGVLVSVVPSAKIDADGSFEINVLRQEGLSGTMDLPKLVLEQPTSDRKYRPEVVHLADKGPNFPVHRKTVSKWYHWSRNISIDEPIIIKKLQAGTLSNYATSQPAPSPVSSAPNPPPASGGQ